MPVDLSRVLTQQIGRDDRVDMGFGGVNAEEGFAQAAQTLVGEHPGPEQVGKFVDADGFDCRDFHAVGPPSIGLESAPPPEARRK